MLSLLALKRQNLLLAAVMLGLSINSREIFIFLGPLFVAMVCSPSCRNYSLLNRVIAISIIGFAVAVSVQLISLGGSSVDAFGREVSSIATEGRVEYLFKFIVGSFLMFPMMLFVIYLYAWNSKTELHHKALCLYACVFVSFFSLSSHTAYYTSWVLVFPCIFLAFNNIYLKPLIMLCLTWVIYNLAITDAGVFTTLLASPWSITMSGLPSFPDIYRALGLEGVLDLLTYSRTARTVYVASLIYLAFLMLRAYNTHHYKNEQADVS